MVKGPKIIKSENEGSVIVFPPVKHVQYLYVFCSSPPRAPPPPLGARGLQPHHQHHQCWPSIPTPSETRTSNTTSPSSSYPPPTTPPDTLSISSFNPRILTALLLLCSSLGDYHSAHQLFDKTPQQNRAKIGTWNSPNLGLVRAHNSREALGLFRRILREKPDKANVLAACTDIGTLDATGYVQVYMSKMSLPVNVQVGTALVDAKCGSIKMRLHPLIDPISTMVKEIDGRVGSWGILWIPQRFYSALRRARRRRCCFTARRLLSHLGSLRLTSQRL